MNDGHVVLGREEWQAILDALGGDDTQRDEAYDALHRHAPATWFDAEADT
ncbi:hypothetical protein H0B56_01925 [Haloechinothrix sp. YIM 98757]|uniref:Uncharacterized protein n=1 Tax=Haloechinothrix aidingensis TaxID=2752311 RepID=A0A837ZW15_9PSEU|nr:hypothetical protein [Haloechinothrix aidingensis]MBA0124294.1 hypothetical protein [Haloechinothrix aidingensis]